MQENDFDVDAVLKDMKKREGVGAVVDFIGVVRSEENLRAIEIEAYDEMAREKLEGLEAGARKEFDIKDVVIVHRTGVLKPGDNIVLIAVSSAHRKDAFLACEWLIDELKKIVPIWKKDLHDEND